MAFRDVTGHRRVVELLARSIARDSLPPSLIFAGPQGSGKRFAAVAVAQALNCTNPESQIPDSDNLPFDACGRCAACARIARGVHPDVLIVEPGDNGAIKVDQVRDLIERAAYRPFEGRRRVVIIDDADALVHAAQNALLKTLEEPPPSSVFVLITSRPDMLLATVRSRCIRLAFAARGAEAIDEEAREIGHRVLAEAASSGDPARRLEAAKELLAGTGGGNTAADDREQVASHLRAMATLLRDVESLATRSSDAMLANPDLRPAIERLAAAYRGRRAVRAFEAVDRALHALDGNAAVKVVADWVVLQL